LYLCSFSYCFLVSEDLKIYGVRWQKQVAEWDIDSGMSSVTRIRNAASAHSAGVECSMQARLAQGLDLGCLKTAKSFSHFQQF
jgi:hypothetical protein